MKKIIPYLLFLTIFITSCEKDDCPNPISTCGNSGIITTDNVYNAITSENYTISAVALNGNCLSVTYGSSGCDASTWITNLYSTNNFFSVFPLQREAKLEVITNQLCGAVFQKTVLFDLTSFQISGQNQIPINLLGWSQQIIYNY